MLLYLSCFLVGGIFIVFAAAEGFDGIDFDQEFEWDIAGSEKIPRQLSPLLRLIFAILPILSLRFWTFAVSTFGLSGLLLQLLRFGWSEPQVFWASVIVGAIVGSFIAFAVRWLQTSGESDSLIRAEEWNGLSGKVTIPFDAESRGQVCIDAKGNQIYMLANTTELKSFQKGDRILVVGIENNSLWVVSEDSLSTVNTE